MHRGFLSPLLVTIPLLPPPPVKASPDPGPFN
jgi:hypothetical protein